MNGDDRTAATRSATMIPYCATCGYEGSRLRDEAIGKMFVCPKIQPGEDSHYAAAVKGDTGKFWLRRRLNLYTYESKKSPLRFFKENVGAYLLSRFFVICIVLSLSDLIYWESIWGIVFGVLLTVVSVWAIIDILLANTSVAFVSRFPADPLRSVMFTFLSFVTLTLAFSVFFVLIQGGISDSTSEFRSSLDPVRAVYFSFVTITTLGYGEILPVYNGTTEGYLAHILIVVELICGLYFLLIVLATVASWVNESPTVNDPLPYSELISRFGYPDSNGDQVSARCKHCGCELVPDHKGPCPQCGQVGKEIIVTVGSAIEVSEALSVSWTKARHRIETRPVQAALWGIVTVGSPFLGLVLAGWPGALAGLGLTAVSVVLGFYAVTRVREIERGGQ